MDYTFLDDRYFHIAGVDGKNCYSTYLTEDQGKTITVFPISLNLGKRAPFQQPEEIIKELNNLADDSEQRLVSLMIEGEKLGAWDETYELCYNKQWLKRFFNLLEENSKWLILVTPQNYLRRQTAPRVGGRIYFPCLSYADMMKWVLTKDRQRSFKALENKEV